MFKLFSKSKPSNTFGDEKTETETQSDFYRHPNKAEGPKGNYKGNWKFDVEKVIYNAGVGSFALAVGECESDSIRASGKMLAIRWNGAELDTNDIGYPTTSTDANWFPIPREFNSAILNTVEQLKNFESLFEDPADAMPHL